MWFINIILWEMVLNDLNLKLTGFKSQCIIFSLYNNRKQCTNECANLRIKFTLKPW
jgi:hypothetical protein